MKTFQMSNGAHLSVISYWHQSNEANDICLIAEIGLKSLHVSPVNTVPDGGQIERL